MDDVGALLCAVYVNILHAETLCEEHIYLEDEEAVAARREDLEEELQKLTDNQIKEVDKIAAEKEKEIMEV